MTALLHKVPCILHYENRVGIKLLTMVLLEGFSNAQQGLLFSHIHSQIQCIESFAQKIKKIFNNEILGDINGPAQLSIPMNDEGTNIGIVCLDNN
jgi:hypothetical protein